LCRWSEGKRGYTGNRAWQGSLPCHLFRGVASSNVFCVDKCHTIIGLEETYIALLQCSICFCWNHKIGTKIVIFCDFTDFTWFQPDFINFRVFKTILHIKHILTRKIVRFYELNRDFNNLDCNANIIGWRSVRWSFTI